VAVESSIKEMFPMKRALLPTIALLFALFSFPARAENPNAFQEQVKAEARRGFEEILDLWRGESYDALYYRLVHSSRSNFGAFADQMNHSGRKPACCWEKLQDVSVTYISRTQAGLSARLGIEVEGVGTRFVTRTFTLVKDGGVWKIPESDVISLAEPNMQRIPKEILYRTP
jgi:hypothetical protein